MAEVASSLVHGEPVTEKRSTFQAHVCAATSLRHVEALMEVLLANGKLRAATHNILAYRILQPNGTYLQVVVHPLQRKTATNHGTPLVAAAQPPESCPPALQDSDDDGEAAAGGRLLQLLQLVQAENVAVVVSRWYGGILLGPARFALINNTARQLLDALGYVKSSSSGSSGGGAKKGSKKR